MRTFAAVIAISILGAVGYAQTEEPVGPTKPVVVVNSSANPVPVSGTVSGSVSVTNTLNVKAEQSGS